MSRHKQKQNKDSSTNAKRLNDRFYNEAKDLGYLARSVFKLQEINKKQRLFPINKNREKSFYVLDLGCSPGSWLQFCCQSLGSSDKIVGVDLAEIKIKDSRIKFIKENIFDIEPRLLMNLIDNNKFDLVLSDMAPKTTGIKISDQQRSFDLCEQALNIAILVLKNKGNLLVKIFQSQETNIYINLAKKYFKEVKRIKPESSRKESAEIYILATEFLSNV